MATVIDHLIYGVRDLEVAAARLADMGLTSYFGGRHPALGTSNRIVPLGSAYIELLAPAPASVGEGRSVGDGRFVGWMVRGAPMGEDAVPMERVAADGTVLRWRLAGLTAASVWELDPLVPVRIEWGEGVTLPGMVEPIGALASVRVGVGGIEAAVVELADGREVVLAG